MKPQKIWPILITALLVIQCGESYDNAEIEESGGVRYINNKSPFWGDQPEISLEFIQKIGDLETIDENYMLYQPCDVVRDNKGNIYILDSGNFRVQKYDSNGKYLETFGNKGQGPAEINNVYSMNLFNDNTLFLCDFTNSRIQKYSLSGKKTEAFRFESINRKRFSAFRILSTGKYLTQPMPILYPDENLDSLAVLYILNEDCSFDKQVGSGRAKDFGEFTLNAISNYVGYDVGYDDSIIALYYFQNKIEKYNSEGELIFQLQRPLDIKLNDNPVKYLDLPLISNSIAIDPKNRIWVSTFIRNYDYSIKSEDQPKDTENLVLEIFNGNGILLGRIPQPELSDNPPPMPITRPDIGSIRIFDDRIYFIDVLNQMCVYEYKIIEK